jgi:hypothetical protein
MADGPVYETFTDAKRDRAARMRIAMVSVYGMLLAAIGLGLAVYGRENTTGILFALGPFFSGSGVTLVVVAIVLLVRRHRR